MNIGTRESTPTRVTRNVRSLALGRVLRSLVVVTLALPRAC
jgi:hypothetical protein